MRKLYLEYFHIPEYGKIREKAFLGRIAASVSFIVICLFAMGITAYAYFSASVITPANTLTAANYKLCFQVNGVETEEAGFVLAENPSEEVEYKITATLAPDSTATTGYCVVTVDFTDEESVDLVLYTCQIGKDEYGGGQEFTFTLALQEAATVTFEARWGTSIYYNTSDAITENECVSLGEIKTPPSSNVLGLPPIETGDGTPSADEKAPETSTTAATTTTVAAPQTSTPTTTTEAPENSVPTTTTEAPETSTPTTTTQAPEE